MLNVPVSKIVLDQARVCPLIGQGEAASVAEHVRVSGQGEARQLAIVPDRKPCRLAAPCCPSLTHEKSVRIRLHLAPIREPRLDSPQLVGPQRVGGRKALFEPGDVQDAAFGVHLGENQAASLGDPEAMPEHEEEKAAVAGFVPGAFGGGKEFFDFVAGEVFSFIHPIATHAEGDPEKYSCEDTLGINDLVTGEYLRMSASSVQKP